MLEAVGGGHKAGVGSVSNLASGIGAAHQLHLVLLADHECATAARRLFRLGTHDFAPHRGGIVINRAGVTFRVESRLRHGGIRVLAGRKGGATPRILNRFQVRGDHGFCYSVEPGLGTLTFSPAPMSATTAMVINSVFPLVYLLTK